MNIATHTGRATTASTRISQTGAMIEGAAAISATTYVIAMAIDSATTSASMRIHVRPRGSVRSSRLVMGRARPASPPGAGPSTTVSGGGPAEACSAAIAKRAASLGRISDIVSVSRPRYPSGRGFGRLPG